jgi:hypothetical protein
MAVFSEAERILLERGPILNLYYYVTKFLIKKGIRGFHPNIRAYYHLAELYRE